VAIPSEAPGAFAAARRGVALMVIDGWFDGYFIIVWQIGLFVSLGGSIAAFGGAMALAGLVGAACGLWLGRHIDAGHGRRAALIAGAAAAALVSLRAVSLAVPWLAVIANALGALFFPILIPVMGTALYNMAKSSPCPFRFQIATEAGWDIGCMASCLVAAALFTVGVPLGVTLLLALPGMAVGVWLLRRYYAR
jgi:MFS transporter, DHA1 family, inner membrane transport protein